jgi:hypothetical protein
MIIALRVDGVKSMTTVEDIIKASEGALYLYDSVEYHGIKLLIPKKQGQRACAHLMGAHLRSYHLKIGGRAGNRVEEKGEIE